MPAGGERARVERGHVDAAARDLGVRGVRQALHPEGQPLHERGHAPGESARLRAAGKADERLGGRGVEDAVERVGVSGTVRDELVDLPGVHLWGEVELDGVPGPGVPREVERDDAGQPILAEEHLAGLAHDHPARPRERGHAVRAPAAQALEKARGRRRGGHAAQHGGVGDQRKAERVRHGAARPAARDDERGGVELALLAVPRLG